MVDHRQFVLDYITHLAADSGWDADAVVPGATLESLGFNSLEVVELMLGVEAEFPAIRLRDDDWNRQSTVAEIIAVVGRRIAESATLHIVSRSGAR